MLLMRVRGWRECWHSGELVFATLPKGCRSKFKQARLEQEERDDFAWFPFLSFPAPYTSSHPFIPYQETHASSRLPPLPHCSLYSGS